MTVFAVTAFSELLNSIHVLYSEAEYMANSTLKNALYIPDGNVNG